MQDGLGKVKPSPSSFYEERQMPQGPSYGGQAVMEGVLMRGRTHSAIAVRRPQGDIITKIEPAGLWGSSPLRKYPFTRGLVILGESLVKGMSALQWSANVALEQEGQEVSGRQMAVTMFMAILVAGVIFFATPAVVAGWTEELLPPFVVHLLEGVIRIGFLLAYLLVIGRMPDVRRLFAYHGAEHKTIHAYEAGVPLVISEIQRFSPAHPRCGTSFLLTVMVVAVFVFAFLGQPPVEWRILSRVLLLPVVAGVSYEVLRFGATHLGNLFVTLFVGPGLALQKLTTREPDDDQVEVALAAFHALREVEAREGVLPESDSGHAEINA